MIWGQKSRNNREISKQSGNVLFLILIAVALFAALSFAISQSDRGGGTAESETRLVNSTILVQSPSQISLAVQSMIVSGIAVTNLEFNTPPNFANCTGAPTTYNNCVFHPDGGGATSVPVPANLTSNNVENIWHFNMHFEIENIGTSTNASLDGNDLVAFAFYVSDSLCQKINEELGILPANTTVPTVPNINYATALLNNMTHAYTPPATEYIIGTTGGAALAPFDGQPQGCFNVFTYNIYYHVLLER